MQKCPDCGGSMENHEPDCPRAEKSDKKKLEDDLDSKSANKHLAIDCATHVTSEQWGYGECISGRVHTCRTGRWFRCCNSLRRNVRARCRSKCSRRVFDNFIAFICDFVHDHAFCKNFVLVCTVIAASTLFVLVFRDETQARKGWKQRSQCRPAQSSCRMHDRARSRI